MEKGEEGKDSQYFLSREPPYKGPAERVNNGSIKWRVAVCERRTTKEQHICVSPVFFFFFILFVFFSSNGSIGDGGGRAAPQMSIRAKRKKDENRKKEKRRP